MGPKGLETSRLRPFLRVSFGVLALATSSQPPLAEARMQLPRDCGTSPAKATRLATATPTCIMDTTALYPQIAQRVVRHYRKHKRDLPWRKSSDAYRIWISEIMLQQTRVTAVIPYYERWFTSFPTVKALADAELDTVLSHWSGLGYYSRARNIHRSAKEIQKNYQGQLPDTAKELLNLPGIGRYTAGAISSIAYGAQEPLVDGNVARLLARVFAIEENIKATTTIKSLWHHCTQMVPKSAPGDFNQGLMELGALICTPKNPHCETCPLQSHCRAKAQNRTGQLPVVAKRKADKDKPLLAYQALFALRKGKLLLAHRHPKGLFGGLWELPQADSRASLAALTSLQLQFPKPEPSMVHKQVLSHRRLQIHVWPAQSTGRAKLGVQQQRDAPYRVLQWHCLTTLPQLGISSATAAILQNTSELSAHCKGS